MAQAPKPHSNRPPTYHVTGNWWSDGTYRVNRSDPASVQLFWRDQNTESELLLVTDLHAILPETVAALDAKCRAEEISPNAYWLGWKMKHGNPWPLGIICYRPRPLSRAEAARACARLTSRAKVMAVAWRRPAARTFACREPDLAPHLPVFENAKR